MTRSWRRLTLAEFKRLPDDEKLVDIKTLLKGELYEHVGMAERSLISA